MTDETYTYVAHAEYMRVTQIAPGPVHDGLRRLCGGNGWRMRLGPRLSTRATRRGDTLAIAAEDSMDDDLSGTIDCEELMRSAVLGAHIGDSVAIIAQVVIRTVEALVADTNDDVVARVAQDIAMNRALFHRGRVGRLNRFSSFGGHACCRLSTTSGVEAIHIAWLCDGEEVVGAVVLVELSARAYAGSA